MHHKGKGKGKGKGAVGRPDIDYTGAPHVYHAEDYPIQGYVFHDEDKDSHFGDNEVGVEGVMVSDGLHVVKTDEYGYFALPAPSPEDEEAGFAVFITKPDGYAVPFNSYNIPQFSYIHKPEGSPKNVRGQEFRFGGLPPTGPLPHYINFPVVKTQKMPHFKAVVAGDSQAYSNTEIGYVRDSIVKDLIENKDETIQAVIYEGDVMGDDLSLYERFGEVQSTHDIPLYYVPGNHDLDFDAPDDRSSFDTFRREWGPEYYSFEIGEVHFIVMDDVKYPCTSEDNFDGLHDFCEPDRNPTYNGVLNERQLTWIKNDLEHVPKDKIIMFHVHIGIINWVDMNASKHQVSNAIELYEALGCHRSDDGIFYPEDCERTVIALGAHSHTNENIRPGDDFEGWRTALGDRSPGPPPFHQIVVGAACGNWWRGDFNDRGVPEAFQRLGAPRGYYIFEFNGNEYKEMFKTPERSIEKQMSVDILTPEFVEWFRALEEWENSDPAADAKPPVNINDLPDTKIVTKKDSYLSVNVWNGSKDTQVYASFDRGEWMEMYRTNPGEGENILETLDPYALKRQMMVARFAYVSDSDEPRASGIELFKGSIRCPGNDPTACTPRAQGGYANKSCHVWQVKIPEDLADGPHYVFVKVIDPYGQEFYEAMSFEVAEGRPPKFWVKENWLESP